jgi:hypothetical protein
LLTTLNHTPHIACIFPAGTTSTHGEINVVKIEKRVMGSGEMLPLGLKLICFAKQHVTDPTKVGCIFITEVHGPLSSFTDNMMHVCEAMPYPLLFYQHHSYALTPCCCISPCCRQSGGLAARVPLISKGCRILEING